MKLSYKYNKKCLSLTLIIITLCLTETCRAIRETDGSITQNFKKMGDKMPTMALYLSLGKNQITQPSTEEMVQLNDVKDSTASYSIKSQKEGALDDNEMDDLMSEAFQKKEKKVSAKEIWVQEEEKDQQK